MEINELLCKDFLWHVRLTKHPAVVFINNWQKALLGQKWLEHLVEIQCKTIDEKRKRNRLMCGLTKCLESGQLQMPFLEAPKPLAELETPLSSPRSQYNSDHYCRHSNLRILQENFPPFGVCSNYFQDIYAAPSTTAIVTEGNSELTPDISTQTTSSCSSMPPTATNSSTQPSCSSCAKHAALMQCQSKDSAVKTLMGVKKFRESSVTENTSSLGSLGINLNSNNTTVEMSKKLHDTNLTGNSPSIPSYESANKKHTNGGIACTAHKHKPATNEALLHIEESQKYEQPESSRHQGTPSIAVGDRADGQPNETITAPKIGCSKSLEDLEPLLMKSCLEYMKENVMKHLGEIKRVQLDSAETQLQLEKSFSQAYQQFVQETCRAVLQQKGLDYDGAEVKQVQCKVCKGCKPKPKRIRDRGVYCAGGGGGGDAKENELSEQYYAEAARLANTEISSMPQEPEPDTQQLIENEIIEEQQIGDQPTATAKRDSVPQRNTPPPLSTENTADEEPLPHESDSKYFTAKENDWKPIEETELRKKVMSAKTKRQRSAEGMQQPIEQLTTDQAPKPKSRPSTNQLEPKKSASVHFKVENTNYGGEEDRHEVRRQTEEHLAREQEPTPRYLTMHHVENKSAIEQNGAENGSYEEEQERHEPRRQPKELLPREQGPAPRYPTMHHVEKKKTLAQDRAENGNYNKEQQAQKGSARWSHSNRTCTTRQSEQTVKKQNAERKECDLHATQEQELDFNCQSNKVTAANQPQQQESTKHAQQSSCTERENLVETPYCPYHDAQPSERNDENDNSRIDAGSKPLFEEAVVRDSMEWSDVKHSNTNEPPKERKTKKKREISAEAAFCPYHSLQPAICNNDNDKNRSDGRKKPLFEEPMEPSDVRHAANNERPKERKTRKKKEIYMKTEFCPYHDAQPAEYCNKSENSRIDTGNNMLCEAAAVQESIDRSVEPPKQRKTKKKKEYIVETEFCPYHHAKPAGYRDEKKKSCIGARCNTLLDEAAALDAMEQSDVKHTGTNAPTKGTPRDRKTIGRRKLSLPALKEQILNHIDNLLNDIISEEMGLSHPYTKGLLELELLAYAVHMNSRVVLRTLSVEMKKNKIFRKFIIQHLKADLKALRRKLKN